MVHLIRRFAFSLALFPAAAAAQLPYVPPEDTAVQRKLAAWQDLKFGLLMHWGPYSEWGVVESWSICPEDEDWCRRDSTHGATYTDYVKNYEALPATFYPVKFDPAIWAAAAQQAGMKYVVFTTKHHDGFCMFDTHTTTYRVTGPDCAFHADPRADVTRAIFDAFRAKGLWAGVYFSKPDWHSDAYWWPRYPPLSRNVNYDPRKYPARWQAFKNYTYQQVEELMGHYGPIDILWLDGGWVRPRASIDTAVTWQRTIVHEQDVDIPRIAAMARSHQPGLLVVDRSVGGPYENYVTPEGHIPDTDPGVPWETCMPMATSWSYVPGDAYKSADEIVRLLVQVVSRGGNLLLNVGPAPDGTWDPVVYDRLKEVGAWLRTNGGSIYGTRALDPQYTEGPGMTRSKDGRTWYLFVPGTEAVSVPVEWTQRNMPKATVLGTPGTLKLKRGRQVIQVQVPAAPASPSGVHMRVVKLELP